MYPNYTLRSVLDEYSTVFYTLLIEGYRIRYKKYQMLSAIAIVANSEDSDKRKEFVDSLDMVTVDPRDILNPEGDSNGIDLLREILN